MSGKIQGAIYGRNLTAPQMLVALAMADHADHDGYNVRPAQATIAWKTGKSLRQVQRIQSELRDLGVLEVTKNAGRGSPTEYRIVPEAVDLRPRKVATTEPKGRHSEQKVAISGVKVATQDGVLPVLTEPSSQTVEEPLRKRDEWWDELVEIFGKPSDSKRGLQNKLVARLKREQVPPAEIRVRAERLATHWGAKAATMPALVEHWDWLGSPAAQVTQSKIKDTMRQRELADALRSLE